MSSDPFTATAVAAADSSFLSVHAAVLAGQITMVLLTNTLHEAAHAFTAWWAGDQRPEIRQRMTLNPIKHISLLLTIVLPIASYYLLGFVVGGAKPVIVDAGKIGPKRMAGVAIAGPLGNLVFAALCGGVVMWMVRTNRIDSVNTAHNQWFAILAYGIWFSIFIAVMNLIPLPPADGSRMLGALMPERMRNGFYKLAPVTAIALFGFALWITGTLHAQFSWIDRGYPETMRAAVDNIKDKTLDIAERWKGK